MGGGSKNLQTFIFANFLKPLYLNLHVTMKFHVKNLVEEN